MRRELFVDGNDLQCEGVVQLVRLCAERAETEAFLREEELQRRADEQAEAEQRGNLSWQRSPAMS